LLYRCRHDREGERTLHQQRTASPPEPAHVKSDKPQLDLVMRRAGTTP
jgi:hypothetical protein